MARFDEGRNSRAVPEPLLRVDGRAVASDGCETKRWTMRLRCAMLVSGLASALLTQTFAQDLAPRAYLVTPIHANAVTLTESFYYGGLNFTDARTDERTNNVLSVGENGRGERIRTSDPLVPNQ
jgi:hypothetical protein